MLCVGYLLYSFIARAFIWGIKVIWVILPNILTFRPNLPLPLNKEGRVNVEDETVEDGGGRLKVDSR